MEHTTRDQWDRPFADGRGVRPLIEPEGCFLADHPPAPPGVRALADREVTVPAAAWGRAEEHRTDRTTVPVLVYPHPDAASDVCRIQPQEGTA
ncbi:hypothetical protein [Streptomyces paromomycinus]|uniref:Uncharacterized protein n=1 Tax=Streptomyces paromomycinus TaxID=92743 RepID=A0A401VXL1_STREY|nr:hypothetical protein [Streptomyces paromomycinus]GCD41807.1 hypothetical protein GKJPGBOP_01464 [Streptomyces paromomycinus]